jgi:type 2 lantibiotic biosynthesis protein LanM
MDRSLKQAAILKVPTQIPMKYSDAELRSLVARAAPLHQRWIGDIECDVGEADSAVGLQRWRETLSIEGDSGIFARRLAFDGLDLQSCGHFLGAVRLGDQAPVPVWATRINAYLSRCCRSDEAQQLCLTAEADVETPQLTTDAQDAITRFVTASPTNEFPFGDIWGPFLFVAREELCRSAGDALNNLNEESLQTFQSQLWASIAYIAALPLSLEFRRFLAKHDPLSILDRQAADRSAPSEAMYRRFVHHFHSAGLLAFFQEYPVLARLLSEVAGCWVEHVGEFCRRLDKDRAALAQLFNQDSDLGQVVNVRIGISDPHHGRRDVVIATFACGLRIVYKPKDLGIDEAFWSFIDWLNVQCTPGEILRLRTLKVLNRTTYGWVEFVEHQPCHDQCEVKHYYRRVGMLLCLTYVLGGTDFHQENVMASGADPVLLDLETMMQPLPRSWDGLHTSSADRRAVEIMHDSVLRTGFLPFWIVGNPGKGYDVSGIGAEEASDTGYLHPEWEHVNSDQMKVIYRSSISEPQANRPMLDGNIVSAEDHVAEICRGFTEVYRLLLAHRDLLLADDGPLRPFRGLKLRCLLRMSKAYGQLLNRRMHPEFLRDGADAGIELERLARDFLVLVPEPDYASPWEIYRAEVDALERLDFPYFSFFSDSENLIADGCVVATSFFSESGLQRVISRVRKLSDEDLRVQTNFILTSIHSRFASRSSEVPQRSEANGNTTDSDQAPLTRSDFVGAAVAIAEQISHAAIRGADGGSTWLSLAFDPTVDRMNYLPMSDNLYDGRIGVAFFLAALEYVTGGAGFRDLALAALMPLRKSLRQSVPPLTGRISLGGAAGLGGQIYALIRIARWLNDDELLSCAGRAAGWFSSKRIACDRTLDVFSGSAGGILGLLTLSAAHGNGDALESAVRCGHHLLKKRVCAETGHLVWPGSWTSRPLTGFGHGAAGIAYAILRLSQASGQHGFRHAAEEAIDYETAVYSVDARNWPDLRYPTGPDCTRFMNAWCNGAAGIGLGRLGGLPIFDTPSIRRDIANALETTRTSPLADEDHACCGNTGRIDVLVEASRRLGRPDLLDEARRRASVLVRRAQQSGRYALFAQVPGVTDSLSLFQGTAGIGYHLLRLAESDRLPCVLLWE